MRPVYRTELSPLSVQMVRGRIGGEEGGCSEHPVGKGVAFSSLPVQRAGGGGEEYRKCHGCAQLLDVPVVNMALKCR